MAGFWRKPQNVAGVGCLTILGLLALVFAVPWEREAEDSPELRQAGAEVVCKEYVSERLKAPGSAEFSRAAALPADYDWLEFTVTGTVDAQNSFGASLRSSYTCRVRLDPATSKWALLDLSIS